ncbi:hypothetical protein EPA93_36060 [Ktedonosporobacter rubrisoli]|uniref:Uncharacterized protein n=1 Tax=Ktedonosporobacter rubrisoli TaxID=2509675 RepID=A0A4P6JZB5_KTERU|nr:hypothetical protein [Ktedonosporobacter rubrisoli]QBD81099.1 hypothetical protein EPA93_36060 [Ktedonosporobacter rubrisoli]
MSTNADTHTDNHKPPSRERTLIILDQLNQARLLQQMATTSGEQRYFDNLFKQCQRWLQQNHIPFYYDEQQHLYLLKLSSSRQADDTDKPTAKLMEVEQPVVDDTSSSSIEKVAVEQPVANDTQHSTHKEVELVARRSVSSMKPVVPQNEPPTDIHHYVVKVSRKTILYEGNDWDAADQAFLQGGRDHPTKRVVYLVDGVIKASSKTRAVIKPRGHVPPEPIPLAPLHGPVDPWAEYRPALRALNAVMELVNQSSDSMLMKKSHIYFCECLYYLQERRVPVIFSELYNCYILDSEQFARRHELEP